MGRAVPFVVHTQQLKYFPAGAVVKGIRAIQGQKHPGFPGVGLLRWICTHHIPCGQVSLFEFESYKV